VRILRYIERYWLSEIDVQDPMASDSDLSSRPVTLLKLMPLVREVTKGRKKVGHDTDQVPPYKFLSLQSLRRPEPLCLKKADAKEISRGG
jgi:hypothetical protein